MDRSLLSVDSVISAAKDFVCIRLATYEDSEEAKFLRKFATRTQSGDLENTVFVILEPNGKKPLCRSARSPHMVFGSAGRLASEMKKIAAKYPAKTSGKSSTRVPQMKDFRLALNVAACDGLPLLVGYGMDEKTEQLIAQQLKKLAFSPEHAGKFHLYSTGQKWEMESISGFTGESGFYLVGPNTFGDKANLAEFLPAESTVKQLDGLLGGYAMFNNKQNKSHHSHVQAGLQAGVDWKSAIPVTDKMSLRAKQQADRRRAKKRN